MSEYDLTRKIDVRTALAELVACDDIVKQRPGLPPRRAGEALKVRAGRWDAAWAAARAALALPETAPPREPNSATPPKEPK